MLLFENYGCLHMYYYDDRMRLMHTYFPDSDTWSSITERSHHDDLADVVKYWNIKPENTLYRDDLEGE